MKRAFLVLAGAVLAMLGASANTRAANGISAQVDSVATVVSSVNVVFQFDLYNCPSGEPIVVVDWQANEPSRPDSAASIALVPFGLSNGTSVQHLTVQAGSGGFLAGEKWVGSGSVACGAVTVPLVGSGQTKSLNGV